MDNRIFTLFRKAYEDENEIYYEIDSIIFTKKNKILNGEYRGKDINDINAFIFKEDLKECDSNKDGIMLEFKFDIDEKDEEIETLTDLILELSKNSIKYDKLSNKFYGEKHYDNLSETDIEMSRKFYNELLKTEYLDALTESNNNKDNLKYIVKTLKKKIKGQDEIIDTVVSNILLNRKLVNHGNKDLIKNSKSNILLCGPTGCGKTLLVSEIADLINVPIVIRSATNYSGVGYVGEDLSNVLYDLLYLCNGDLIKAQNGIICLDEIDKLGDTELEIRKGIAQELLAWVSGTNIKVTYKKKEISFNTSNNTFIFLGAFTKMEDDKKSFTRPIGFNSSNDKKDEKYTTDDYVSFGMQRELMGRINVVASLNNLDKDNFKDILVNSTISPLNELITIGKLYDVDIDYTEDFVDYVCNKASEYKIGARGLKRVMFDIRTKILKIMMDSEVSNITLTTDMFDDNYEFENELKLKQKI